MIYDAITPISVTVYFDATRVMTCPPKRSPVTMLDEVSQVESDLLKLHRD